MVSATAEIASTRRLKSQELYDERDCGQKASKGCHKPAPPQGMNISGGRATMPKCQDGDILMACDLSIVNSTWEFPASSILFGTDAVPRISKSVILLKLRYLKKTSQIYDTIDRNILRERRLRSIKSVSEPQQGREVKDSPITRLVYTYQTVCLTSLETSPKFSQRMLELKAQHSNIGF
ncbi:hypothetical protein RRG08_014348 [Elysia crispata]|uniref:Uncharacterized protein n=1 Tax=Elysia crispata TaxID=231223 RepID=A0AAE0XPM3_9GAST|nr:hypothetical protein RRG08_014348 [Elysia crispata]